MKIFYFLIFFFYQNFSFIYSSDLYSFLLDKGRFPNLPGLGLEAVNYEIIELGSYHPSQFVFDSDCITVIGTNSFLEQSCSLPPKCGHVKYFRQSEGYFGREVIVCYSFHPNYSHDTIKFFEITPKPTTVSYSTDTDKFYMMDMIPTDFFEHFVVVMEPKFFVIPRICLQSFTKAGDSFPASVDVEIINDVVTVKHSRYNNTQCQPFYLSGIDEFIRTFNYPLAYYGCSYSHELHTKYLNQETFIGTYDYYYNNYPSDVYVYSVFYRDGNEYVFISYGNISELQAFRGYNYVGVNSSQVHLIYFDGKNHSCSVDIFTQPISYIFKSPFSILTDHLKSFFEYIFYKLLNLIEQELITVAKLIVLLIKEISKFIFNELLFSVFGINLYTYILVYVSFYFYFSDFLKSGVFTLLIILVFEF